MAVMRYMVIIERGETSWGAHVPDLCACNNAGMADGATAWLDVTEDAWERVLTLRPTGAVPL